MKNITSDNFISLVAFNLTEQQKNCFIINTKNPVFKTILPIFISN